MLRNAALLALGVIAFTPCMAASACPPDLLTTLLPDYNTSHSLADVVHLGDNACDGRFLPACPGGTVASYPFSVPSQVSTVTISVDQYNADNTQDPRSWVEVNGVRVGELRYNPVLVNLTPGDPLPVVTDQFQLDASQVLVGDNLLTIHMAQEAGSYDDVSLTNITVLAHCTTVTGVPPRQAPELSLAVYPNPTPGPAAIIWEQSQAMPVSVWVHDVAGRRVARLAEGTFDAGRHAAEWRSPDGAEPTAGIYFVELRAGMERRVRAVIVVRK